jgi:hypothetical protein
MPLVFYSIVMSIATFLRASAMALGKAHCKPRPILLKIAQNLEGVHQILLKNGVWEDVGGSFHF